MSALHAHQHFLVWLWPRVTHHHVQMTIEQPRALPLGGGDSWQRLTGVVLPCPSSMQLWKQFFFFSSRTQLQIS